MLQVSILWQSLGIYLFVSVFSFIVSSIISLFVSGGLMSFAFIGIQEMIYDVKSIVELLVKPLIPADFSLFINDTGVYTALEIYLLAVGVRIILPLSFKTFNVVSKATRSLMTPYPVVGEGGPWQILKQLPRMSLPSIGSGRLGNI